jgi:hypothetical protein
MSDPSVRTTLKLVRLTAAAVLGFTLAAIYTQVPPPRAGLEAIRYLLALILMPPVVAWAVSLGASSRFYVLAGCVAIAATWCAFMFDKRDASGETPLYIIGFVYAAYGVVPLPRHLRTR